MTKMQKLHNFSDGDIDHVGLTLRLLDAGASDMCHHGRRHLEDGGVIHRSELNGFIICVFILLNAYSNFPPK